MINAATPSDQTPSQRVGIDWPADERESLVRIAVDRARSAQRVGRPTRAAARRSHHVHWNPRRAAMCHVLLGTTEPRDGLRSLAARPLPDRGADPAGPPCARRQAARRTRGRDGRSTRRAYGAAAAASQARDVAQRSHQLCPGPSPHAVERALGTTAAGPLGHHTAAGIGRTINRFHHVEHRDRRQRHHRAHNPRSAPARSGPSPPSRAGRPPAA